MNQKTYFVLAPRANMLKIGQTNDLAKRLKSLQTGCPECLEVLLTLSCTSPFEERQMHARFSQYRRNGEWFEYTGELKSFINEKIKDPKATPNDDLRSINGCIQPVYKFDRETVCGEKEVRCYGLYVEFCERLSIKPAEFERWLKLSDNPREFEGTVETPAKRVNPNTTMAHHAAPYTRWESAW